MTLQHLRSSTANKRPDPTAMADGQIALNTAAASPGLFYKDSAGNLVKAGPVHVGSTAPNVSPASGGTAGNSTGESWLDTSGSNPLLKIWSGAAWQTVQPVASGTVVSTADTGSVTSTMIADGTIVNADVNASAAIAGTKISPDFGSQNVTTTGTVTGASLNPTSSTVPTNGVYLPAANSVAISTGGTGRLFVNSAGVITTDSAITGSQFNIVNPNSVSTYDRLLAIRNGNLTTAFLGVGLDSFYVASASGSPMVFCTNSDGGVTGSSVPTNERLRITSAGLVGIGSSAPNCQLTNTGTTSLGTNAWPTSAIGRSNGRAIVGNEGQLILWNETAGAGNSGQLYIGTKSGSNSTDLGYARISAGTENASNLASFFKLETMNSSGTLSAGLYLDSSQRVGIGTSTPSALLHTAGNALFVNSGDNLDISLDSTYSTVIDAQLTGASEQLVLRTNRVIRFDTGGSTERARIDSSGRLLVGTSSDRNVGGHNAKFQVEDTGYGATLQSVRNVNGVDGAYLFLGKSRGTTLGSNTIVQSGDELGNIRFYGADGSTMRGAAEITCNVDGTPGASDMPGRLVFSTTADGASSPTERMRIDSSGNVFVGKTAQNVATVGCELGATGFGIFTRASDDPLFVNRTTNDGILISLRQDNIQEGSISVSGTTVSYNGGHLARWSQLPNSKDPSHILKGTVMSNLDEMCDWGEEDNEQLNKTKVSDVEGDKNVAGVFVATSPSEDGPLDFFVGMTGDMVIRIAEGVTVERGDLLMSAGDGTAKPQDDDIIRSKTIAKVTSTNVSCTYDDGSYCVPCVLMAC